MFPSKPWCIKKTANTHTHTHIWLFLWAHLLLAFPYKIKNEVTWTKSYQVIVTLRRIAKTSGNYIISEVADRPLSNLATSKLNTAPVILKLSKMSAWYYCITSANHRIRAVNNSSLDQAHASVAKKKQKKVNKSSPLVLSPGFFCFKEDRWRQILVLWSALTRE